MNIDTSHHLAQLAQYLNAPLRQNNAIPDAPQYFMGAEIDTRRLQPKELFIAIAGEQVDGHDFIHQAIAKGAAGCIVEHWVDAPIAQICVTDSRQGLWKLAAYWRSRYRLAMIALTGSCGKTTVKTMLGGILQQYKKIVMTQGNFNNELGVPLTLLRIRAEHDCAVLELGANHAGEIAKLTQLVEPDVTLITNAAAAHLEGFGSMQGVAQAKGEIYTYSSQQSTAIINADDSFASYWQSLCEDKQQVFTFSWQQGDCHWVSQVDNHITIESMGKRLTVKMDLPGKHNIYNMMAAILAAQALYPEISIAHIQRGLADLNAVNGRLKKIPAMANSIVYDDSYNANPLSVQRGIEVLLATPAQQHIAVLGDMAELGEDSHIYHAKLGEWLGNTKLQHLWVIGTQAQYLYQAFKEQANRQQHSVVVKYFTHQEQLLSALQTYLIDNRECFKAILVKGSRSMRMERIVIGLQKNIK